CFGEDLVGWLGRRLLGDSVSCGSPFQEDWGWSVPLEVGGSKFFINIGLMDEPSETPTWLVWVESRGSMSRLFRSRNAGPQNVVCQRLSDILASASEISHVQWSAA